MFVSFYNEHPMKINEKNMMKSQKGKNNPSLNLRSKYSDYLYKQNIFTKEIYKEAEKCMLQKGWNWLFTFRYAEYNKEKNSRNG